MKANFSHQSTDSVIRPTCYFGYEMASLLLERWSRLYSKQFLTGLIHLLHPLSWPSPTLREAYHFIKGVRSILDTSLIKTFFLINLLCVAISHSTLLNTMCTVRHLMSLSGLVKSQDRRIVSPNHFSLPKNQVLKIRTVI